MRAAVTFLLLVLVCMGTADMLQLKTQAEDMAPLIAENIRNLGPQPAVARYDFLTGDMATCADRGLNHEGHQLLLCLFDQADKVPVLIAIDGIN